MDKIYELENCKIKVKLEEGIIRLKSDNGLWRYLDGGAKTRTFQLIKVIKEDYKSEFDKPLNIHNESLMVEIWAHVYCDYYGLLFHRNIKIKWIQNILMKGIERAAIIDCGERELDSNRWIWDFLSNFKSPISWVLPKNISNKNLKN
ncbi:hypothetical protein [Pedobacter jamesrossensis]|uniref:Uncharacterized protein n=1 Tax=Pedobacter jamesrossensis TaxID=1908238 RepID=A0ABV8NH82_9SPHI